MSKSAKLKPGVTLDKLSELTLLSVDELKGPASDYIPKQKNGLFEEAKSIKGAFKFYSELRTRPITINKDELRDVSGLSDQRHRQLANEGHFPAPIKGRYDLRGSAAGLIRYFKELHQRRDKTLGAKREQKLLNEITLQEMDIAERNRELVSLDDMDARLRPLLVSVRQKILGCTMTEDEKDELITDIGEMLEHALTRNIKGSSPKPAQEVAPDLDQAPAVDSDQVGRPPALPVAGI